jgi:hypothetical protein
MQHNYSYESALAASSRINWKIEDVIGGEKTLDFTRPFMPESLAQVNKISFLTPTEKMRLNQIRGHEYLCMFGLVEEFILPYVIDQARPQLSGDDHRVRALLGFAGEEAKHIHLFKRFREEFEAGSTAVVTSSAPRKMLRNLFSLTALWEWPSRFSTSSG